MKNLLTFASGYLVKLWNFYTHLSLETVLSALKLTQICCINMNIFFFLKTGNLITNLAPTLLHIPSLKYCPHNLTKYEAKQNSKIPIFELFSEFGEIWRYKYPNIPSLS